MEYNKRVECLIPVIRFQGSQCPRIIVCCLFGEFREKFLYYLHLFHGLVIITLPDIDLSKVKPRYNVGRSAFSKFPYIELPLCF